jgi:hypothetical protein
MPAPKDRRTETDSGGCVSIEMGVHGEIVERRSHSVDDATDERIVDH